MNENILKRFEEYCEKNKIEGKEKEKKIAELEKYIQNYMYEPGEAIGILAAQSISEPTTQMTMRSYTLASQSDRLSKVTQGLPRLIEIFDTRKTFERNMLIFLKEKYNTKEKAKEIANKIKSATISDLTISDSIDLVNMKIELEMNKNIDKEKLKKIVLKQIKNCSIETTGNKIFIKPSENDSKDMRKIRNKIMDFHINGLKGIENVVVIKEDENWLIQTEGTNIKKVLEIPEVDPKRTRTNDVHQVYDSLGIEAAHSVLLQESRDTLEEQGLDVDLRHLVLLADTMTFDGTLKSIGRYGISGKKASVLSKANFEETKRHLINASFYGEVDNLDGIIENIMIGQVVPVGTGIVNLTVDIEKIKKLDKK